MIKLLRGILVGLGLGFALFYTTGLSSEIYQASLALLVLVGVLIPLESQERRMEKLIAMSRGVEERLKKVEGRLEKLETTIETRLDEEEEEEPTPRFEIRESPEPERYIPAYGAGLAENRAVMPHGRRTVECSVEDVARKLASMQREGG
ncbi:hypothetical protein SIID45300_01364 [Candidatus Magnetaquicoccaceae bacterium FCR-1]|uniref:Uncharacterized protein n=1 Tax=Candidatus Magnetaquiglobus chichijimensis TaxID=3141448 RepID=A0ABQ0C823_9PROT